MCFKKVFLFTLVGISLAIGWPLNNSRQAVAAEPETQEVTFLVSISVGFYSPLSDYIGDDTIGVLFKKFESASRTLTFAGGSPPCDGHEVSGTSWSLDYLDAQILNRGGPTFAAVYRPTSGNSVPEHSILRASDVTDIRACWIRENSAGDAVVQPDGFDGNTVAAVFIITGDFPL